MLLISNCTVQTTRSVAGGPAVRVLSDVRANLRPRRVVYRPEGTIVETRILLDPGTADYPTDIREGDWIYIQSEDDQPEYRPLRPLQVNLADHIGSPFGIGYVDVLCIGSIDV